MTDLKAELARIQGLARAATAGPWVVKPACYPDHNTHGSVYVGGPSHWLAVGNRLQDAAFIASIHQILSLAERAIADNERLRTALAEIREEWAGAECGKPVHAQEAYAIELARRMFRIAASQPRSIEEEP